MCEGLRGTVSHGENELARGENSLMKEKKKLNANLGGLEKINNLLRRYHLAIIIFYYIHK